MSTSWRVEHDEGRECFRLDVLKNGGHRRQRMKDPGLRLVPETPIDGSGNACIVPDEGGYAVRPEISDRIPAVVPEVVEDENEAIG